MNASPAANDSGGSQQPLRSDEQEAFPGLTVTQLGRGDFSHLQIHDKEGLVATVKTERFEEVLSPGLAQKVKALLGK